MHDRLDCLNFHWPLTYRMAAYWFRDPTRSRHHLERYTHALRAMGVWCNARWSSGRRRRAKVRFTSTKIITQLNRGQIDSPKQKRRSNQKFELSWSRSFRWWPTCQWSTSQQFSTYWHIRQSRRMCLRGSGLIRILWRLKRVRASRWRCGASAPMFTASRQWLHTDMKNEW